MKTPQLKLAVLDGEYAVHRFAPENEIPREVFASRFFSITKTEEELSIVCDAALSLASKKQEPGWSALKVQGPLDFALTGILAKLAGTLAESEISLFAVSTYDTDYILVRTDTLVAAKRALEQAGYLIEQ